MKNLILVIFLVTLSTLGYAQSEKTNTIVITQADSVGLSNKVLKVLTDREYTVTKSKDPSTITTVGRTLKNGARVSYLFLLKGPEITLTGKILVAGQAGMTIDNKGSKGTPITYGWEEMEKIAKALGGKVSYK